MEPEATHENDRDAKIHDRAPRICDVSLLDGAQRPPGESKSLDRALEQLRLEGAIFLRAEYTES